MQDSGSEDNVVSIIIARWHGMLSDHSIYVKENETIIFTDCFACLICIDIAGTQNLAHLRLILAG